MRELRGRTAVVTGAAAGIGRALALRCAREGMNVAAADLDAAGAERTAAEARRTGAEAMAVETDAARYESVEDLARRAWDAFGGVHLLCNNAGVLGRVLPSWKQPIENWKWVFDVNVFGVVHGVRAFVGRMIEQGEEGYVLNTASIAGLVSGPFFAPYNASKHAVVALSECLHHELRAVGSRIEVGALCPGWVNTKLASLEEKLPEELRSANLSIEQEAAVAERDKNVRRLVAEASDPDEIAEIALEAVRDGRFYVFPHPERKADVERRLRDILDEAIPSFGAPSKRG